jgi:transposase
MTLPRNFVGVDICKDRLDVYSSSTGRHSILANTPKGVSKLIGAHPDAFFVFEATSGCDSAMRATLTAAGAPFARVNPRRAREFARAAGFLAKTDRVDARVLAEMGRKLELKQTLEPSAERQELEALLTRREQYVQMLVAERNRLAQAACGLIRADIRSHIRLLEGRLEKFDHAITALISASEELSRDARRLRRAPGVGPVVSAVLLADLPELGRRDRGAIAALAGLAPLSSDSGRRKGQRRIWGGRRRVRRALYIAALHASRHCPRMRAFRERLAARGKATKTILIAVARKLLVALNAMLRDGTDWRAG